MPQYDIRFLNSDGSCVVQPARMVADGDSQALEAASVLNCKYGAEVWQDDRMVGTVRGRGLLTETER
jgi:hypothetical protein